MANTFWKFRYQKAATSDKVGTHESAGSQPCLRDGPIEMSLLAKLRKSRSSALHASLIIGLILSTTPIFDGCSRGQEAPSEQPSAAPPPPAAQESAPAAAAIPTGSASGEPGCPTAGSGGGTTGSSCTAGEAPPAPPLATPDQLQQLVSPIALYPDSLVAQILTASTYPTQVVDADHFMKQNPNLTGDALAAQVNPQPWDPSVRSLCQFPSVLDTMSQSISWTTALGQAYYVQPQDVLAAIQVMRNRAMAAGTLKSTSQQRVVVQTAPPPGEAPPVVVQGGAPPPQVIVIQPAQPNTVYVPTYNPSTVYGAPVEQPPGYSGTSMLMAGVVGFGAGMLVSSLINSGNNSWGTNWYGQQCGLQPQRIRFQFQLLRPALPRLSARDMATRTGLDIRDIRIGLDIRLIRIARDIRVTQIGRDIPLTQIGLAIRPIGLVIRRAIRPIGLVIPATQPTGLDIRASQPTGLVIRASRPTGLGIRVSGPMVLPPIRIGNRGLTPTDPATGNRPNPGTRPGGYPAGGANRPGRPGGNNPANRPSRPTTRPANNARPGNASRPGGSGRTPGNRPRRKSWWWAEGTAAQAEATGAAEPVTVAARAKIRLTTMGGAPKLT